MNGINKAIVAVMIALSVMISVLFCSAVAKNYHMNLLTISPQTEK